MGLESVYSGSFKSYKVLSLKMKRESLKDARHLKSDKNSSYSKSYKKGIEKGKKRKNKKFNKSLATTTKFFTFMSCIWKRIYFAQKHGLGKCSLYYYISGKVFFSIAGYVKRSNETLTSI